jgi:hypothetical protein
MDGLCWIDRREITHFCVIDGILLSPVLHSTAHTYTHTITAMTDHTPLAVFITTFNMNMRSSKLSDHELRSWLAPAFKGQGKEPELLVIGIQELLPLELARMSRHSQPYGSFPSSLTCWSGFS